jgi:hypothetical protein
VSGKLRKRKHKPKFKPGFWKKPKEEQTMKWITVPEPCEAFGNDGKPVIDRMEEVDDLDAAGLPKLNDKGEKLKKQVTIVLGKVDTLRYLRLFVFNEVEPNGEKGVKSKLGIGYEANERIHTLIELFKNAKPGDDVCIDNADYEAVVKCIKTRVWQHTFVGAQFFPIEQAWIKASDKPPELKSTPAETTLPQIPQTPKAETPSAQA